MQRLHAHWILPILAIALFALASSASHWSDPVPWTDSDSLYYQAQVLELRGASAQDARRTVFTGPLSASLRKIDLARPVARRTWSTERWHETTWRFFRRRWLVPAMAAAIYPIAG